MNQAINQAKNELVIYNDQSGINIKVTFQGDTIWLTQSQIAELFGTQRPAITKHLNNIFKTSELSQKSVCSKMEHTASDGKTYKTQYYNLDAIIAIGYRVNSKKATHFRIWATTKLRDHILKGYTINEQRLKENSQAKLKELESTIKLFQSAIEAKRLSGYEKELLNIITDYTKTWILLNKYDNDNFTVEDVNKKIVYTLDYEKIKQSIEQFKIRLIKNKEATEIFGREVDYKLKALLGNIEQTFDNQTVYQSIEEKAAHLFYFAIKDHPFTDGNKRIGSLLFLLYLIENHHFYNKKGDRLIPDSTLTTLALLVAESDPSHKDIIIKLVINLIKK